MKRRLVDFIICGSPMRSSNINSPRAIMAKAVAVPIGIPIRLSMPIIPNSCTPIPAGVIGTNASAVTMGCIRKKAIQDTFVMPRAMPRNHHSNPFSIQQATVMASISGIAFLVLWALSLNSSSLPTIPPVKRFMKRMFNIFVNMIKAFFDQVQRASTVAPVSIRAMPNMATIMPTFVPTIV